MTELEKDMKVLAKAIWDFNKKYDVYVSVSMPKQEGDDDDIASITISKDGKNYPSLIYWGYRKGENEFTSSDCHREEIVEIDRRAKR
jgi:hypothetical protein